MTKLTGDFFGHSKKSWSTTKKMTEKIKPDSQQQKTIKAQVYCSAV